VIRVEKSIADFVPVAPQVAFSGMGQARIEINLFIRHALQVHAHTYNEQSRRRMQGR